MNDLDKARIQDMLDNTVLAVDFMFRKTREDLDGKNMLSYAVARAIELIGEAAYHVSEETHLQYPEIEWAAIAGMRHRLIHDYLRVDYDIVWKVTQEKWPDLIGQLENVLEGEPDSD